ncbi:hypothetical protein ACQI5H_23270 [Mycobacterium heidelbergense]|uniref:hypothetical protein n=1 Tax=Mycobacterium heidelbergense TaxID=53376 RepID=UPI003CE7A4DE
MDIQIPPQVSWVATLVGPPWPQGPEPNGSESAWWQHAAEARALKAQVAALVPDLARAPTQLVDVLEGQTQQEALHQIAQLFGGPYAVDKILEALDTFGDAGDATGTNVQAYKLGAVFALIYAGKDILQALASAPVTGDESLAWIPVIVMQAKEVINRFFSKITGDIAETLAAAAPRTTVAQMAVRGGSQAVSFGLKQQGFTAAVLAGEGHPQQLSIESLAKTLAVSEAEGLAAGGVGTEVAQVLGSEGGAVAGAAKAAVAGMSGMVAANTAGGLTTGDLTDPFSGVGLGALGAAHGAGEHTTSMHTPTENQLPANGVEAARAPSGDLEIPARDGPVDSNAGLPQTNAAPPPTKPTPPALSTGRPDAHGSPGAGDPGTRSATGSTPEHPSAPTEVAAQNTHPSEAANTADSQARPATALPGASETTPAARSHEEGVLNLTSAPHEARPPNDPISPPHADSVAQSAAAGSPAGTPDMPRAAAPEPSSTPPASSERGSGVGPPSPTSDARAGLVESSSAAGESAAQPTGAAAARSADTTAAHTGPSTQHGDVERAGAGHTSGSVVERPAQPIAAEPAAAGQATRSAADAHLVDRGDATRGDNRRPADPLTTRRDPARPDNTRDDTNRSAGARRGKLRRSGVARDIHGDLQPATATRAKDPLAEAEDIGIIKASHDNSGPGPGEPKSHDSGRDGHNTPDPGIAGGGVVGKSGEYAHGGPGDSDKPPPRHDRPGGPPNKPPPGHDGPGGFDEPPPADNGPGGFDEPPGNPNAPVPRTKGTLKVIFTEPSLIWDGSVPGSASLRLEDFWEAMTFDDRGAGYFTLHPKDSGHPPRSTEVPVGLRGEGVWGLPPSLAPKGPFHVVTTRQGGDYSITACPVDNPDRMLKYHARGYVPEGDYPTPFGPVIPPGGDWPFPFPDPRFPPIIR